MKEQMVELNTPDREPFYFRAKDVILIRPANNTEQSWITTEQGVHVLVLGSTRSINEFLLKCKSVGVDS